MGICRADGDAVGGGIGSDGDQSCLVGTRHALPLSKKFDRDPRARTAHEPCATLIRSFLSMKHTQFFSAFLVLMVCSLFGAGCDSPPPAQSNSQVATSTPTSSSSKSSSQRPMDQNLSFPGILPDAEVTNKIVRIQTTKGEIAFELLPQEGPKAASNFVYLTKKGFYDGLIFHRVETWVIQGGDPTGTGMSGPGYSFEDDPVKLPYKKGIVAMANAGPNTNGSQFFIMTKDVPLGPNYSIFGRVISGQDVADRMAVGDTIEKVTVEEKK